MNSKEYWRSRITNEQKKIYDVLSTSISMRRAETPVSVASEQEAQTAVVEAFHAVWLDHPEYYWLTHSIQAASAISPFPFGSPKFSIKIIHPTIYTPGELSKIEAELRAVRKKMDAYRRASAFEKLVAVVTHLVENTVYEINAAQNQNAASALYFKRAQCSGIAKACKLLLDYLCVPCIVVNGDACSVPGNPNTSGPHSWNIVEIDGQCYHVDPTYFVSNYKGCASIGDVPELLNSDSELDGQYSWDVLSVPLCSKVSPYRRTAPPPTPSTSGGFCSNENVQTVSSLYELRTLLGREFAKNCDTELSFRMNVNMGHDKLYGYVKDCISKCLNEHSTKASEVQISRVEYTYKVKRTFKN